MSGVDLLREAAREPLATACSLPFASYTDPGVFEAEAEHIFRNEWVFVCMEGELPSPGDYFALTLAGEPLVLLRGGDRRLRALSNVCRHRGTPLLDEGPGNTGDRIVCPYHAWIYDLGGSLKAVPFEKTIAVERDEHRLGEFHLDTWNGLVFVHLGKCPAPLSSRLSGIDDHLGACPSEGFDTAVSGPIEIWRTNWKLAMENAMESYHLFRVHPKTLEPYAPTRDAYYIAGSSEWTLTGGRTRQDSGMLARLFGAGDEPSDRYVLLSLPPSFVGVLSAASIDWVSVHPLDTAASQIRTGSFGLKGSLDQSRSGRDFVAAFLAEDRAICERVQGAMRARRGRGGKLVDMDRVVVDFHHFLAARLGRPSAAAGPRAAPVLAGSDTP